MTITRTLLLIGLGGGLGSVLRYMTTIFVTKQYSSTFPLATFIANVIGCLIIGILIGLFERQQLTNHDLKFLLITGFCGGYTTFSAFTSENLNLLQSGNALTAILYIAASILVSLGAVWLGITLTKLI